MAQVMKKHFVFDLDDTLVDGRLFCGETMARSITHFEPHINSQTVIDLHDKIRGGTIDDLYKTAAKELNLKTSIEDLVKMDSDIMTTEFEKIKIFEGVVELLEHLKSKGKVLHMCTNRKSESLIPILKSNKIHDYFENIVSCIDVGSKKPDPKSLLELVRKTNDPKKSFIYFGDSEIDYQFARNAGIEHIIFDQYLNGKTLFKKLINMFVE